MRQLLPIILLSCLLVQLAMAIRPLTYERTDTCRPSDTICRYILIVQQRITMLSNIQLGRLVVPNKGKLYEFDDTTFSRPVDETKVIQTDGYWQTPRMVIVANNSLPGPAIEVYVGQQVEIEVINGLESEGLTIHWHGIIQRESNVMDGVAFVTQCPINPGNSFTYKFKVETEGTHFYHSHIGAQRTQGLFGAFTVRNKPSQRTDVDVPEEDDYSMMLTDWNHEYDSTTAGLFHFGLFYGDQTTQYAANFAPDGGEYQQWRFHSALINGISRFYDVDPVTNAIRHNEAPLTVYRTSLGRRIRFRAVNGGTLFPLRVSVDRHELIAISSDGDRFVPTPVQSFIISPGERFDVLVLSNQAPGSYMIIAETLEVITSGPRHLGEAILTYAENPLRGTDYDNDPSMVKPQTNEERCTAVNRCKVLNCPFGIYKQSAFSDCIQLQEIDALEESPITPDKKLNDLFHNYVVPFNRTTMYLAGTINSKEWMNPHVALPGQANEARGQCENAEPACSPEQICTCIHTEVTLHNNYYQLVVVSIGAGINVVHPAHMHGHHFEVVRQGFAPQDPVTGLNIGASVNPDLKCLDANGNTIPQASSFCGRVEWTNPSWNEQGLPGVRRRPVRKDTVNVPRGGYAVIRWQADNPGYWFMHCHIELHSIIGMAVVFNEAPTKQLPVPPSFPVCRDFPSEFGKGKKPGKTTTQKPRPRPRPRPGRGPRGPKPKQKKKSNSKSKPKSNKRRG